MSPILFISDLHLNADEPDTVARFRRFCRETAPAAQALYILGDFFEYWAGDDDLDEAFNSSIVDELRRLSERIPQLCLLHGNRDFLLGDAFARATGITLLPDPFRLEIFGRPTILTHGNALCTDDAAYQQFRAMVRDPQWQARFLAQPLSVRKAIAEDMRRKSETSKQQKSASIMDVNPLAVADLFRLFPDAHDMIHGHTHRPACHTLDVDGYECRRWVLQDWYQERAGGLCVEPARWQVI